MTYAAKCGHHLFVHGLCELGAMVDLAPPGPGGLTPLADACFHLNIYLNNPEAHPALEMAGQPEDGEYFGQLPNPDYAETVRLLLEFGADPNRQP